LEDRYHATTQNRFYPDICNLNKNITMEEKLISTPTYYVFRNDIILKTVDLEVLREGEIVKIFAT